MNRKLTGLLCGVLLLTACDNAPPPQEDVVRPVRYIKLMPNGADETRIFSGVTKAALETDLSFKVAGLVTALNANVGDTVERGTIVARLEPTDFQVALKEAEAGLERAKAEKRNAEAAFERTRELYENRNAARSDLDTARAAFESAGAQLQATEQQLEKVRLQLSYTELKSPQACTIAVRRVETNQNVSAGQPIVRVNCGDCPEIRVDVPGVYIGRVVSGSDVEIAVAAMPNKRYSGVVTEVGVGTEQGRSIYPVVVQLQDGCNEIRSGMAADVTLSLAVPANEQAANRNALVVPLVAVGEDRDGNYVFVLEPADGEDRYTARRRAVIAGQPSAAGIPLEAGVNKGDLVATAGVRRLVDGQIVTLLEPSSL